MGLEAAAIITTVVSAVATGVSTYESVQAGQQQKKAADFRAKELEQQALEHKQEAAIQIAAQDERQMKVLSSIRATAAASGVDISSGSPLQAYATSSDQARINDMYAKYAGNIMAQGTQSEAELTRYGGKIAQQTGYLNAASDAISGVGKIGGLVISNPDAFHIS